MPIQGIQRRLRALEECSQWVLLDKYPPLTHTEILEIERRARSGQDPSKFELARIERQSPIIDGELMMCCYGGQLSIKRYLGIDLAEI